jgi:hypothetical protein
VAGPLPTAAFATAPLDLATIAPGERFGRIHSNAWPDPLGFGKSPSRFSDPRRRLSADRFGVLYLGSTFKVCFVETLLRDQRDGLIGDLILDESELTKRSYATVEVSTALSLLDLRNDGPLRMGIPSDVVRGSRQSLARKWSLAFYKHPTQPDGIVYPSRLNGETNIAVYDHAVAKLRVHSTGPLLNAPDLARTLDELRIGLR